MARPKKSALQATKTYSLADEVSSLLALGENPVVTCKQLPRNNSGGLVVGENYKVTETQTFCGNKYVSILTDKGCFWYHETHFELEENK